MYVFLYTGWVKPVLLRIPKQDGSQRPKTEQESGGTEFKGPRTRSLMLFVGFSLQCLGTYVPGGA
jgi:hypothetical protein